MYVLTLKRKLQLLTDGSAQKCNMIHLGSLTMSVFKTDPGHPKMSDLSNIPRIKTGHMKHIWTSV